MAATQRDTLLMFTALRLVRTSWQGSLLAAIGLNDAGRALALASLASGAASIFLEEDPGQIRMAVREGCCTFAVHSLDEALRIVKNEVRQRRAITVALGGDPATWLQDMAERGVQPQAFAATRELAPGEEPAIEALRHRGMRTIRGFGLIAPHGDSIDLESHVEQATAGGWSLREETASSPAERRAQDAALLQSLTHEDRIGLLAGQWLQAAPSLFPRALQRTCWWKD